MQTKLTVIRGKASKSRIDLQLPAIVGRSREAEVTVAHPMVSRRHCQLADADGQLVIRDLGSLNGTIVAGERVEEAPLAPGDQFTVGPLTFRVDYEPQPQPPSNAAALEAQTPHDDASVLPEEDSPEMESLDPDSTLSLESIAPPEGFLAENEIRDESDSIGIVPVEDETEGEEEPEPTPPPPVPDLLDEPPEETEGPRAQEEPATPENVDSAPMMAEEEFPTEEVPVSGIVAEVVDEDEPERLPDDEGDDLLDDFLERLR